MTPHVRDRGQRRSAPVGAARENISLGMLGTLMHLQASFADVGTASAGSPGCARRRQQVRAPLVRCGRVPMIVRLDVAPGPHPDGAG